MKREDYEDYGKIGTFLIVIGGIGLATVIFKIIFDFL